MLSPVAYLLLFDLQESELSILVEIGFEIFLVAKGLLNTNPSIQQNQVEKSKRSGAVCSGIPVPNF